MEHMNLSGDEKNNKDSNKGIDPFFKSHSQQHQEKIESKKQFKILIIDPSPAELEFYDRFFPNDERIMVRSIREGLKLFERYYRNNEISAVILDDSLGDKAPLVVSLLRTLIKKASLDINIFVTYNSQINTSKYFVKPDVTLNKDNGQIDVFY
jgi:hypothetical protein